MDSIHRFWDAVQRFAEAVGSVGWQALLIALALHVGNLTLRTRAWRNIVAASYPASRVRWSVVFGSYMSGVGLNAVAPARGGDVLKLWLLRDRVAGATYPTLAATLVVETLFDFVVATSLLIWAFAIGAVPDLPSLPDLPAFEFSWLADHPVQTLIAIAVASGLLVFAILVLGRRIRAFWARVRQGFAILRTPREYLTGVVSYQAVGWCLRVATAYYFLEAFHIPASVRNGLLVLVVQGVATSLPLTPGGVGPKQALVVVVLGGVAAKSDLLAFSVGMELAILVTNLLLGVACAAVMLKGFRIRTAIREARAERAAAEGRTGGA